MFWWPYASLLPGRSGINNVCSFNTSTNPGPSPLGDASIRPLLSAVDKTINGLARIVCVQGAEDEEPGLGRSESEGDGFQVTHLTYKNNVGILPQGSPQAVSEGRGLDGNFPLSDDAALIAVHELDRFLHRDNMTGEVRVDVVEKGCESGGFPGSGWAGNED